MENSHIIFWFPDKININILEKFKPEFGQALALPRKGVSGRMELAIGRRQQNLTGQLFFLKTFLFIMFKELLLNVYECFAWVHLYAPYEFQEPKEASKCS